MCRQMNYQQKKVMNLKEYQRYTELNELRQSLTTKNYRHYYIHLDESLDKLIGQQDNISSGY